MKHDRVNNVDIIIYVIICINKIDNDKDRQIDRHNKDRFSINEYEYNKDR